MKCTVDESLLYSYLDGTIETLEKIFFEEHLKHCEKCNKELNIIKLIDESLLSLENDIPERLSLLSELIVENCMQELEGESLKVKISNYFHDVRTFSSIVINSQNMYYEDPVNNFVKSNILKASKVALKPIKHYINKKKLKFSLLKLLKVG